MRAQRQFSIAIAYGLNTFQVFVQFNAVVGYVVCILLTGSYYYIAVTAYGCAVCIYGVNMGAVFSFAGNNAYVSACFNLSMLACFGCYFLQLFFGCSLTGSCKASISSSLVAKSAYGCSSAIHNNIASYYAACCYTAACPDCAFAAADAYHCVIIAEKLNIIFQCHIIFRMAVFFCNRCYSNISTIGNSTVFECFCFYIFQLAIVYCVFISFTVCYAADFTGIVDTNNTIDYGAAIQHNYRCALAVDDACSTCCTIQCQLSTAISNGGNIS